MISKRGFDAHNNPAFYRQIGKDPEQLTSAALALLEAKFRRCSRVARRVGAICYDGR